MRATWLTDIHLNFLRPLALAAFYERVRAEQPQVLLVTGDIGEADSVVRFVGELAEIAPIYLVLGNHDYYRGSIASVRAAVKRLDDAATWLPAHEPLRITRDVVLVGADGWGDARCGDLDSSVVLSDWQLIEDLAKLGDDRAARIAALRRLGDNEARALADQLARAPDSPRLVVLTHVPPFPEACVYADAPSEPGYLPWFTCIATGEVLRTYARAHPTTQITVLCGHAHGVGVIRPEPNLEVRTGGWRAGEQDYGNPLVQATFDL